MNNLPRNKETGLVEKFRYTTSSIVHDNYKSVFNPNTGFYMRTDDKYTGKDVFAAPFPELIDIGIMETCVCSGMCQVDCYQKACDRTGSNMSLSDYQRIIDECKGKVYQVALGGAGDPDTHENFREILEYSAANNIVPNFTTSGIAMTKEKADLCRRYCGAVAVSQHSKLRKVVLWKEKNNEHVEKYVDTFAEVHDYLDDDWSLTDSIGNDDEYTYKEIYFESEISYTYQAIQTLLEAGVKTNIHYVLSAESIDEAIVRLENNAFPKGINAVVFLLYKPVGLGKQDKVLKYTDERLQKFFKLVEKNNFPFKIGFDSCSCSGLVNFCKEMDFSVVDYCEGGRFSMYISADMKAFPCSFANQTDTGIDIKSSSIKAAWDKFEYFRERLSNSCLGCSKREYCMGGCPLLSSITLCNRPERTIQKGLIE